MVTLSKNKEKNLKIAIEVAVLAMGKQKFNLEHQSCPCPEDMS